jgi:flagellar basal body P-ring formation protein FlgA
MNTLSESLCCWVLNLSKAGGKHSTSMKSGPRFERSGPASFWLGSVLAMGLAASSSLAAPLDNLLQPLNAQALPAAMAGLVHAAPSDPQILTGAGVVAELEKELGTRLSLNGELKLELVSQWQTLKLSSPSFIVQLTDLPPGGLSRSFGLRFKIVSGADTFGPFQVFVRAQLWQEVWVAATRLERGQALDRTQVTPQKVDIFQERLPLISTAVDPGTLELTASVSAGRTLSRMEAIGRPLIRKGQFVEAVAQHGAMSISMKALALENGAAGDLIRLRNVESRKDFNAQVLNENKVQVRF